MREAVKNFADSMEIVLAKHDDTRELTAGWTTLGWTTMGWTSIAQYLTYLV